MMRKYFFILLLYHFACSHAQKATISGYIIDSTSGETLIGANILESNTFKGAFSSSIGFFSITLEQGIKTIIVSYVGYENIMYPVYRAGFSLS